MRDAITEIRFYHLTTQILDQALPQILSKVLESDRRALVKLADEKEVRRMNEVLWTYRQDSFLPHGSKKDGHGRNQPIFLTHTGENENDAEVLILTSGVTHEDMDKFDLCCEMLNGDDKEAVKAARTRWKAYKETGFEITYWQQSQTGGWEKKT